VNSLICPCGQPVGSATKHLHRPDCPLDARALVDRIAQAIGDPGSVLERRPDESVTRWSTRAAMFVFGAEDSTLPRGLFYLDSAEGGVHCADGVTLRCQTRVANADGSTFHCELRASHETGSPPRRCRFVPEREAITR